MHELQHFEIGDSYGGNQDWMRDPWMKLGGCAALAAVDSCIYLTLHKGIQGICPEWIFPLTEESYNRFAEYMRPYLPPRYRGVNKPSLYTKGFSAYLRDMKCTCLAMDVLPMGTPEKDAEKALKDCINNGFPVPILHLLAKTPAAREYHWHWFLLNGYCEEEDGLHVRAVTYGAGEWLRFDDLWNELDADNGGLILYRTETPVLTDRSVHAAAAILCDRMQLPTKILATVRTAGEYSGCCCFPGIKTEAGESGEQALRRLLQPKNGNEIRIGKLIAIAGGAEQADRITAECYLTVADTAELSNGFSENGRWLSREDLHAVSWVPDCRELADIIYAEMTDAASFQPKDD